MKRLLLFLLLLFCTINNYSQTSTEKYNSSSKRYEYFDNRGNMVGYKQYNSYLNQWEYYDTSKQTYQPQSSIDVNLIQKTLSSKQSAYDTNLKRIQEQVQASTMYIYACSKSKNFSYELAEKAVDDFDILYVNKVRNGKYDLYSDSVTDNLIKFLSKGAFKIACDNFKDCN